MNQKYRIFGAFVTSLLIIFSFSTYYHREVYSQASNNNDKNNKNGIKDNRGYAANVIQYDKMKNCSNNLSERANITQYLTYFNCGHVTINENNKTTTRQFTLIAEENHTIPISDVGHAFRAWTFNGTVPGPTMRMTEGDLVKITLINSPNSIHPHSLHLHSMHSGDVDGIYGPAGAVQPGKNFTYTFIAQPYGLYPYHCHVEPVDDHINRGLYGVMIIDPKIPRIPMHEMVMLMNGYDMNYTHEGGSFSLPPVDKQDPTKLLEGGEGDRKNNIYTVNGIAFEYMDHPIHLIQGENYRIYLVNMLDFDLINSFHLHGMLFNYITGGTTTVPDYKNDIVTQTVADRGILEFTAGYPGIYMFHAHQAEFTEKGWMGYLNVTAPKNNDTINNL
ncbi:MAG: multicopper oxidase domain-containing protein [Candidatus Nitrosocosmicus sp.]